MPWPPARKPAVHAKSRGQTFRSAPDCPWLAAGLSLTAYTVEDETNLGGSSVVREALVNGDIDVYWEYTGTAWLAHLGHEDAITNSKEAYDKVKEELEFQKSEQFIDSKNVAKQDAALASEFLLIGDLRFHILRLIS